MQTLTKSKLVAMAMGILILVGVIGMYVAQASPNEDSSSPYTQGPYPPFHEHHQMDPDKMAQKIADTYGVDKQAVLNYHNQGVNFKDLSRASLLAKASGKSLKEVMATKTYDNTWKDVAQSLGVTHEKIMAVRQDIAANQLQQKLGIAKQTSLSFLHQGYRPRDIAVASQLSQNTGKPLGDILGMRKINNTWGDVAQSLGVSDAIFTQDMGTIQQALCHGGHHRHHHDPMMQNDGGGMMQNGDNPMM